MSRSEFTITLIIAPKELQGEIFTVVANHKRYRDRVTDLISDSRGPWSNLLSHWAAR